MESADTERKVPSKKSGKTDSQEVVSTLSRESAEVENTRPRLNTFALISFVWALLAGGGIAPIIFGHVALAQIKRFAEGGKVFAVIGLILGYLSVVVYFLFFVGAIVAGIGGYNWMLSNAPQLGMLFGGGSYLDPMLDPNMVDPAVTDPALTDPNYVDPNMVDPNTVVPE